jgi:hypothetical protein
MSKPNEIRPPMIYSGVMSSLHQSLAKGQQPKAGRKENQAQADEQYVGHRNTSATFFNVKSICGIASIRGQGNKVRGQESVKISEGNLDGILTFQAPSFIYSIHG